MVLSSIARRIDEGTTPIYTAVLRDDSNNPIPISDISSMELTYYDIATEDIINSRDSQNIKNASNVTIHATSGLLTWNLQPEDTDIHSPDNIGYGEIEAHVALFEWTLFNGRRGKHEVRLDIVNLRKVG